MMTFTGRIGSGAKTEIDNVTVKWSVGDNVVINGVECASELSSDGMTATFTGEVEPAGEYKAYYPANLKNGSAYVLPKIQKYNSKNSLSGINPMYAESTTTDLTFYNICAVVRLVVKGTGTVKMITVTADQPLSGEFTIQDEAAVGFYAAVSSGTKLVKLDCGPSGVELDGTEVTTFYIALPQGDYTNLRFKLQNSDGDVWKSQPVSMKLTAGKICTKEYNDVSFVPLPDGALPGGFTVNNDGRQIYFSKGNLQYLKTTNKWQFAANQYDIVETSSMSVGENYENQDVITLFGWSASGQNHNNACYQPWSTSVNHYDYYAYGNFNKNLYDNDGSADWGYSYCKQQGIESTKVWRTLSKDEFAYLFDTRTTTYGSDYRYAEVKVNDVCGILLFPDEFEWMLDNDCQPTTFNSPSDNWNNKNYTTTQFSTLESAGCVFLPTAGYRYSTPPTIGHVGLFGHYWSSSYRDDKIVYALYFRSDNVYISENNRFYGFSVRLVYDVD